MPDIVETAHRLTIVPRAGFRNCPDVWCEEALVYLADDVWDGETTTTISLRRSSIWQDAPLATYECCEALIPDTGDIYILQARHMDQANSPVAIAGLYRNRDGVPVWLAVSKRSCVTGRELGLIYRSGPWVDTVREPLKRIVAVDSALETLRRAIEASMPRWRDLEARTATGGETENSYIARMKYLRDVWDHYSLLKKATIAALWEGQSHDRDEAIGRAHELSGLAAPVATGVSDAASILAGLLSQEVAE